MISAELTHLKFIQLFNIVLDMCTLAVFYLNLDSFCKTATNVISSAAKPIKIQKVTAHINKHTHNNITACIFTSQTALKWHNNDSPRRKDGEQT